MLSRSPLVRCVSLAAVVAMVLFGSTSSTRGEIVPGFEPRRPASDAELRYWLENMVWDHQFTTEEIQAATGMSEEEIGKSLKRWDIRPETRPKRADDAPLRMRPWPGGRKLSDWKGLEGTRQRETKASVFTPWDPTSYLVLDVPEAIWSQYGLIYLAHVHVPTIWTRKNVTLEKLEWTRRKDEGLELTRKLPNGVVFHSMLIPTREAVRMTLTLTNGTKETLSDLRVQNCIFLKGMKGFDNASKPKSVADGIYAARGTADGKRWIITAWTPNWRVWGNPGNPCFHSDPVFDDCPPGETKTVRGWLSFYEGDNISGELARIKKIDWASPEKAERREPSGPTNRASIEPVRESFKPSPSHRTARAVPLEI